MSTIIAARRSTDHSRLVVLITAVMLFLLAGTNGRPLWWSSGLFVAVIAPLMIIARGPLRLVRIATSDPNRAVFYALIAFFAGNVMSALVTPSGEAWIAVLLRCLLPLLVYVSMVGLVLHRRDVALLLAGLAAGAAVVLGRGIMAYIAEWGFPNLHTVLWARYNVVRMMGYSEATLGNVGHMGSYVALVVPPLMLAAGGPVRNFVGRAGFALVIFLGIANLIVSGSRTGLAIMLAAVLLVFLSRGVRKGVVVVAILVLILLATLPSFIDLILGSPELVDRYLPFLSGRNRDSSTVERIDSVVIGWQTFMDNFAFGVGPGMSAHHNYYSVPHQSFVHQLSELGVIGGLAFIWLNAVVLFAGFRSMIGASASISASNRFIWLVGPTCWLMFGIVGGITFNSSLALVWIGLAHAMLALSGAMLRPPQSFRVPVRPSVATLNFGAHGSLRR